MYVRKEAVLSSAIEGTQSTLTDLLRFEAAGVPGTPLDEVREVSRYVAALQHGIKRIRSGKLPLSLRLIREIHGVLMTGARGGNQAPREFRRTQNWVGGTRPGNARFVPPPPHEMHAALDNLERFLHDEYGFTAPVIKAGLAHAQFETIHPFADGNGRVGRALIHVVLRRRGLAARYVPPVSLVLAADAKEYISGLTAFRQDRPADWILLFARAIERAAAKASELVKRLSELQELWRERAGRPRHHSSAEALIVALPAHPIVTVATAQTFLGRSKQAVNEAIAVLAGKGVLHPVTLAKRNRVWEAREVFAVINDVERELATPSDDDEPARPAPSGKR
jgi:Fic family protein